MKEFKKIYGILFVPMCFCLGMFFILPSMSNNWLYKQNYILAGICFLFFLYFLIPNKYIFFWKKEEQEQMRIMKKSKISKKARKVARAIDKLLVAIIEEPKVAKVLNIMFNIGLLIGFIGFAGWLIFVLLLFITGKGELVTWWWNFNRDYPIVSIPWGGLTIFAVWFIDSILKLKPEPKKEAQTTSPST